MDTEIIVLSPVTSTVYPGLIYSRLYRKSSRSPLIPADVTWDGKVTLIVKVAACMVVRCDSIRFPCNPSFFGMLFDFMGGVQIPIIIELDLNHDPHRLAPPFCFLFPIRSPSGTPATSGFRPPPAFRSGS